MDIEIILYDFAKAFENTEKTIISHRLKYKIY